MHPKRKERDNQKVTEAVTLPQVIARLSIYDNTVHSISHVFSYNQIEPGPKVEGEKKRIKSVSCPVLV